MRSSENQQVQTEIDNYFTITNSRFLIIIKLKQIFIFIFEDGEINVFN